MQILLSRWTEPEDGNDAQVVNLTTEESQRVKQVIDWLKENAGQDYGHALCSWELLATEATGKADMTGIEEVLDWITLNSRYNETDIPGDYYGGKTNSELDGR